MLHYTTVAHSESGGAEFGQLNKRLVNYLYAVDKHDLYRNIFF